MLLGSFFVFLLLYAGSDGKKSRGVCVVVVFVFVLCCAVLMYCVNVQCVYVCICFVGAVCVCCHFCVVHLCVICDAVYQVLSVEC